MDKRLIAVILVVLWVGLLFYPVSAASPVASFFGNPAQGYSPLTTLFSDTSTGSPTGWAWFFGDELYNQPWIQLSASGGFSGRQLTSVVVLPDGNITLMGGQIGGSLFSNQTYLSTNNGASFTLINGSSGWPARMQHTSVAMPDGSIVLMGGYNSSSGNVFNDTWRSTDEGAHWQLMNASSGWRARNVLSSVAMSDGNIILMGGNGFKDAWRSTDEGATWTLMNGSIGWPFWYASSAVVLPDNSIEIMGGWAGTSYSPAVWRSTDEGANWMIMNLSAWPRRGYETTNIMPDGSIVMMGGDGDSGALNDVWRSTDKGATWVQVNSSAGWSARYGHASVAIPNGSIILISGTNYKTDVWQFSPQGSNAQNPTHTYTGTLWQTFNVSLTAYNSAGYNISFKPLYVTLFPGNMTMQFNYGGGNDKVVTNQTFLIQNTEYQDVTTWSIILTLGIVFLVLSNILPSVRGAAVTGFASSMMILWAAWGATHIDIVTSRGVASVLLPNGQVQTTIMEIHSVYHHDWLAVILGALFIFSCITNVFIIMDLRNIQPEQIVGIVGMKR